MKTIAGKTVLLTGASGGIGVFIARVVREQATVVGVSRSKEELDKTCSNDFAGIDYSYYQTTQSIITENFLESDFLKIF